MFSFNIVDHVSEKKNVYFRFYQMDKLYYETELGLVFEIPISDTGTGTFLAKDKALNYMRWIRPALKKAEEELTKKEETDII
jgi:hypothetical protein